MISEVKRKKEYKEMEKFFVGKIFFEMFLNETQVVYFKLVYILYKFGRDIQCVCWLTDNASKKKISPYYYFIFVFVFFYPA